MSSVYVLHITWCVLCVCHLPCVLTPHLLGVSQVRCVSPHAEAAAMAHSHAHRGVPYAPACVSPRIH